MSHLTIWGKLIDVGAISEDSKREMIIKLENAGIFGEMLEGKEVRIEIYKR